MSDFISLNPGGQDSDFHIPETHTFQKLMERGDEMADSNNFGFNFDFTGYVPKEGSSSHGFLSLNFETTPGGVGIMDVDYDSIDTRWRISNAINIDFSSVNGTIRNCSGGVTPWNTIITCEEGISDDLDNDGYRDFGWSIEIDPNTRSVIDQENGLEGGDKLWVLGNFSHENAVIHPNRRTVYQGVDSKNGHLYKFVADVAEDLSKGSLYVYKGNKEGSGKWIKLENDTPQQQNSTLEQSRAVEATIFSGGEDVEISPIDGFVYYAVKNENVVYRFKDDTPLIGTTVSSFETFVGGMSYEINEELEKWGTGNDNLAFDDKGDLWVLQDGVTSSDRNYIWVVAHDHTQQKPKVKIFGRTPRGSEPTGMTFTPDFQSFFVSLQHPSSNNRRSIQIDALGDTILFDRDVTVVISRKKQIFDTTIVEEEILKEHITIYPNPSSGLFTIKNNKMYSWILKDINGIEVLTGDGDEIDIRKYVNGVYFLVINEQTIKLVKE